MSKRVFIISSSPRKGGNSDLLCDQFMKGALEAGHHVEKARVSEKHIGYCTGCGVCISTHRCVQRDDMDAILDAMVSADVIVLATPVYFYSMCAQLKIMIDRLCPRYTEIKNKAFQFIVSAADSSHDAMERTLEGLRWSDRGLPRRCS